MLRVKLNVPKHCQKEPRMRSCKSWKSCSNTGIQASEHRLKRGRKEIELKLTRDRKANNDHYPQGVKNRMLPRSES